MSFSFEFHAATAEDATKIVADEHAPQCIKDFINVALTAFSGKPVYVKAFGHLYNNDYKYSTSEIKVNEIVFRAPKVPTV